MSKTKIFYNAHIITLDPENPREEAMAVQGERILALGSNAEILALDLPDAEKVDLQGKIISPGFNDSHLHLINWGQSLDGVGLNSAHSVQEIVKLGQEYIQTNPERDWILGRGFNEENFKEKQLPTRFDLDQISSDKPILFTRACGHICIANSKLLQLAGLDASTLDPHGGSIDRDPLTLEPNGILRENARNLVRDLIPQTTKEDIKRVLEKATQHAASLGLTTVQSNDLHGAQSFPIRLAAYKELDQEGKLPIRVNLQASMPQVSDLKDYLTLYKKQPNLSSKLSLGPLKLFLDGSLGGHTAALNEAYQDRPETKGLLLHSQKELEDLVNLAAKNNLQIAIHAIGDRAIKLVLASYEQAKKNYPNWNKRPRIIHCQIAEYDQLKRMAELKIVADIQPVFVGTDLHFVENRVGFERTKYSYAWKTMHKLGVKTAGGSDCPVESANPFLGLYTAITRQDQQGFPVNGWQPQECLEPLEALKLFTQGSAYANHSEDVVGTLKAGYLADFIVLNEDPTRIEPTELLELKVLATYVGGTLVHSL